MTKKMNSENQSENQEELKCNQYTEEQLLNFAKYVWYEKSVQDYNKGMLDFLQEWKDMNCNYVATNDYRFNKNLKSDVKCRDCNDTGYILRYNPFGQPVGSYRCDCKQKLKE